MIVQILLLVAEPFSEIMLPAAVEVSVYHSHFSVAGIKTPWPRQLRELSVSWFQRVSVTITHARGHGSRQAGMVLEW